MSGIAGLIRLDGASATLVAMNSVLARMRRRGPDRAGAWALECVALGHTLLATTPEANSELQPWRHSDSGQVVVTDSRFDCRDELLAQLGFNPGSASDVGDARLVQMAYAKWGGLLGVNLLGDFAVAIWDARDRRLVCARDIMGVRPFYYCFLPNRLFAFASEADALLALPEVPREIDEGRIADALVGELEGIDSTCTFFQSIKRLPPAHVLSLENGKLHVKRYWDPLQARDNRNPTSEADWLEAVSQSMRDAVRSRLRGTGRVGSMLSGGLDSSTVVALAARDMHLQGVGLTTFTAVDSSDVVGETAGAELMRAEYDLEGHNIDASNPGSFLPAQLERLSNLSEPFDASNVLIASLYAAARDQGVRCLMDGMPADNLYSTNGYEAWLSRRGHFVAAYRYSRDWHRFMLRANPVLRALWATAYAWAPTSLRRARAAAADSRVFERDILGNSLIDREFAARVDLWGRFQTYAKDMSQSLLRNETGTELSCMTAAYITNAVERYGRAAAYFGVEPRHPFLDRRVIELHARLPMSLRFRQGWPKWALRAASADYLPTSVSWRKGRDHLGWRFNHALMGAAPANRPGAASWMAGSRGYVDSQRLAAMSGQFETGDRSTDFTPLLFALGTESWLRKHR